MARNLVQQPMQSMQGTCSWHARPSSQSFEFVERVVRAGGARGRAGARGAYIVPHVYLRAWRVRTVLCECSGG